jgi:NAD(P)H-nitrite reductase large subunit
LRNGEAVPDELLDPAAATSEAAGLPSLDPAATVCSCNAVSRASIDRAIVAGGLTTLEQVANATRASTGCGGCAADVVAILGDHRSSDRNNPGTEAKPLPGTIAA